MYEIKETIYECEYCGLKSYSKEEMQRHEISCPVNPNRISCNNCKFGYSHSGVVTCRIISGADPVHEISGNLLNFATICSKYKNKSTNTEKGETK